MPYQKAPVVPRGGLIPQFKPCAGCKSPAKCKAAGTCLKQK